MPDRQLYLPPCEVRMEVNVNEVEYTPLSRRVAELLMELQGFSHCKETTPTRPSITVAVQSMVKLLPAVTSSDGVTVTFGAGRSGIVLKSDGTIRVCL